MLTSFQRSLRNPQTQEQCLDEVLRYFKGSGAMDSDNSSEIYGWLDDFSYDSMLTELANLVLTKHVEDRLKSKCLSLISIIFQNTATTPKHVILNTAKNLLTTPGF